MATNKLSIVASSNPPLIVQLFPVDSDTGENGIDLSGVTNLSAFAKLADGTGSTVTFASASVVDIPTGKVLLEFSTTDFESPGTYNIQISYLDSAGKKHIYPSDGNTLVLRVTERII